MLPGRNKGYFGDGLVSVQEHYFCGSCLDIEKGICFRFIRGNYRYAKILLISGK